MMASIETLPDGRVQLNVWHYEAWTRHIFCDMATLEKYYDRATQEGRIWYGIHSGEAVIGEVDAGPS